MTKPAKILLPIALLAAALFLGISFLSQSNSPSPAIAPGLSLTANRPHFAAKDTVSFTLQLESGRLRRVLHPSSIFRVFAQSSTQNTFTAGDTTITATLLSVAGQAEDLPVTITPTSTDSFQLELSADNFLPGQKTLSVEVDQNGATKTYTQDFAWGVLAINTHKPVYKPGEIADIAIAVLNSTGHMVCDAQVKLTITGPNGTQTILSTTDETITVNQTECATYAVTDKPDYQAAFTPAQTGTYSLFLEATTPAGSYTITDTFQVEDQTPFDITRSTATRIYPFGTTYLVTITATPNANFQGTIEETIPAGFTITDLAADGLTRTGDQLLFENGRQTLRFEVDWQADRTYTLSYTYDAPDQSPEFFLLGPLRFYRTHQEVFTEARPWQIASDAEVTIATGMVSNGRDEVKGAGPAVIFVDDQNGYAFYFTTATKDLYYTKSTNGGTSWGSPVTVSELDIDGYSLWFDQQTPGDTSGTVIHIAFAAADTDLGYYISLDTSNDSLGTAVDVTGSLTVVTEDYMTPFISKATDGDLYYSVGGSGATGVWKSTNSGANWSSASLFSGPTYTDNAAIMPLASGDMLYIWEDDSASVIYSRELTDAGTWDASDTTVLSNIDTTDTTALRHAWGVAIYTVTGDIYLAAVDESYAASTNILTALYDEGTRGWTSTTNVLTGASAAVDAKPMVDDTNGDVYVVYTRGGSGGHAYYKKSTDSMANWGTESSALSTTADDYRTVRTNMTSNERLFAMWYDDDDVTLYGDTIADPTPASNSAPSAPTSLETEGATNPSDVTDFTPEFSAIYNDSDAGDIANAYQIEVNTNNTFTGTVMWDSGKESMSNVTAGNRSGLISYNSDAGASELQESTTYYWRIKFWDDDNAEGTWSDPANFTMTTLETNTAPSAPTLLQTNGQTNPTTLDTAFPYFSAIYNDDDVGDIAAAFQLQVNTAASFDGTTLWDSGKTGMPDLTQGDRSRNFSYGGSPLDTGTTYYWQIKFWDDDDAEGTWSSAANFKISLLAKPPCSLKRNADNTAITVLWNDNSTTETNWEIERNPNATSWSSLVTLDPNQTQYTDGTVSAGSSYQYRVRATDGVTPSDWCTTNTLNLGTGNVNFEGINFDGVNLY